MIELKRERWALQLSLSFSPLPHDILRSMDGGVAPKFLTQCDDFSRKIYPSKEEGIWMYLCIEMDKEGEGENICDPPSSSVALSSTPNEPIITIIEIIDISA